MATHLAIAATTRAVLGLLQDAYPREEFGTPFFRAFHPRDFEAPAGEGISLFLYRIAVNASVRNLPPRLGPDGRRFKAPMPLDLYYLLTPWADDPERQQRLLGWAMRTLEDTPILPAGLLNHYVPEDEVFRPNESVELVCDPLALQDLVNVWDKLKPRMQTSVTYAARMVAIESTVEIVEAPLVQTRQFDVGRLDRP